MKKTLIIIALLLTAVSFAQKVKADVVISKPLTTTQRNALTVPGGEIWKIFNSTTVQYEYWNGSAWVAFGSGGTWGSITGTLSAQTDLQSALDGKQDNISLTTTGTSGAATFAGSVLNIPNYASSVEELVTPIDAFHGNRISPVNNINGFFIDTNINGATGYLARNTSVGANAYSGFVATNGDVYSDGLSLTHFNSGYFATYLRNNSLLYATNDLIFNAGKNTSDISFRLGNTATSNLTESATDAVLNLNANRTIVVPNLTTALITTGGAKSIITKEYGDANYLGGGSTTFSALTDTPASYTGNAGKFTKVNAGETALEYTDLVQQYDPLTRLKPLKWIGTQAEYDIDFPSGHGAREVVILDAVPPVINASDIVFTPNGSIAAINVQTAIQEVRDEAVDLTSAQTITGTKTFNGGIVLDENINGIFFKNNISGVGGTRIKMNSQNVGFINDLLLPSGGTVATLSDITNALSTSASIAAYVSDETGSGSLVFATSPTLITPSLGVATATSINGATITSGTLDGSVTGTNTGDDTSEVIQIACSDLVTNITTGTSKAYFRMPYAMTLTGVRVSLLTAGTVTGITVDINEAGVSVLSTLLTTDATEKTSQTAVTAAVISDSALADDAEITIDFDAIPTAGKGVIVTLKGTRL